MVAPRRKVLPADHENDRVTKKRKAVGPSIKSDEKKAIHSMLREEEPSFPRGGASVLTPLEHRQIQIQAKKDVLFEQKTGTKRVRLESEDEENEGDELGGVEVNSSTPRKTKLKAKQKKEGKMGQKLEEPALRIEGLSYKVYYNGLRLNSH